MKQIYKVEFDNKIILNPIYLFTYIILSIAFIERFNTIETGKYYSLIVSSPIIIIALYKATKGIYKNEREVLLKLFTIAIFPIALAVLYSFTVLNQNGSYVFSEQRGIKMLIRYIYIMFIMLCVLYIYKEKSIKYMLKVLICSYFILIISSLPTIKISGLIKYALNPEVVTRLSATGSNWLEVNDLGLSIGMLLLYELVFEKEKISKIDIVFGFLVFYLCHKRIALAAFLFTFILASILKCKENKKGYKKQRILMLAIFIASTLYIYLISSGKIYDLTAKIGFDFSARALIYKSIQNIYYWSPQYLGKGFGFTNSFLLRRSSRGIAVIHNDILRIYIELGFWGALLWYIYYLNFIPKYLYKNYGSQVAMVYCILTAYAYIVYTTDNTMTYFIFQMTLFFTFGLEMFRHDKSSLCL